MDDITTRNYQPVSYHGWTAETPADLFAVLAQLMTHLHTHCDGAGMQLLGRVWRVNNPLLRQIEMLGDRRQKGTLAHDLVLLRSYLGAVAADDIDVDDPSLQSLLKSCIDRLGVKP
jgi:hypothetical protein